MNDKRQTGFNFHPPRIKSAAALFFAPYVSWVDTGRPAPEVVSVGDVFENVGLFSPSYELFANMGSSQRWHTEAFVPISQRLATILTQWRSIKR